MDFPTTRLGILMVFQIIYCICSSISTSLFFLQMAVSRYLATSVICHLSLSIFIALLASPTFRKLLFSFRKVWGYLTLLISWFIDFNYIVQSNYFTSEFFNRCKYVKVMKENLWEFQILNIRISEFFNVASMIKLWKKICENFRFWGLQIRASNTPNSKYR